MDLDKNQTNNTGAKSRLFDIEEQDKAVLVIVNPRDSREAANNSEELRLLCESAGVEIVDEMSINRQYPDPRYFIGKGNSETCFIMVQESEANVLIVGVNLSPSQQSRISKVVGVRVVDRTQLILDIFAQRARTNEGILQVELAQLEYLLPRLSGKGVEMSRIGGGSSGGVATRGPGETKLETDKRRVRKRITTIKEELESVVKQRTLQNKARRKLMIPNIALVGYTSAGKSTLLNRLASSDVETHAKLFATLDPTTRRVDIEGKCSFLMSDTVGFLKNLPHHLIAAFKATLEEVVEADFLIHVVDSSHQYVQQQIESVLNVLRELKCTEKQIITVFNKCDKIKDQSELRSIVAQTDNSCYVSALTGEGIEFLERLICIAIEKTTQRIIAILPYDRGDLLTLCHDRGRVIKSDYVSDGIYIECELSPDLAYRLSEYLVEKQD